MNNNNLDVPFQKREHHFIDERVERLRTELTKYTKQTLWDAAYNTDGTSEYVAWDLIEALAWQHLGVRGYSYLAYTGYPEGVPTQFYQLRWSVSKRGYSARTITGANFEENLPHLLTDVDNCLNLIIPPDASMTLEKYRTPDNLMINYKATVNGYVGFGNLGGMALVCAWGVSEWLW